MKKLSICLIVGPNDEKCLERCLRSFSSIADEFVVVQAPGNRPFFSNTLYPWLDVPIKWSVYQNHVDERIDWPHVDDFAKARQVSFDLATGDWLMWVDADDVLPDTLVNREFFSRLKAGVYEDHTELLMTYVIPDVSSHLPRERIAKRSADPRWSNPVHEAFTTDDKKRHVNFDATILHASEKSHKISLDRNLRILEFAVKHPELYENQKLLKFYLHRELMQAGRIKEAIAAAKDATGLDEIEHYEVMSNLGSMLLDEGDLSQARACAHGAINTMPWRREAYSILAQIEQKDKKYLKMLGYTMAMRGIDEPKGVLRPWSQRDQVYGWLGAFQHHWALRLCGRVQEAEACEETVFQAEGATITIIHPTMCRADLALMTYNRWMSQAECPGAVQWIFAIDEDDVYAKEVFKPFKTVIAPRGARRAAAHARKFATGKRVEVISDGWETVKGWDTDFSKIKKPSLPWKLTSEIEDYPNIIFKAGTRHIICAKEGKSPLKDYQPPHCHFELGWEVNTSHIYAKWLLSRGELTRKDVIVTLPGRQFLYETCFDTVLTWEEYCEDENLEYMKPYRDASNDKTLDLVEYFERNWHRYDDVYFDGPSNTWGGGVWDLIQDFKSKTWVAKPFILLSLRKRPHESRRDTSDDFAKNLLRGLRDALDLPIFLVGLSLPDYGVEDVSPCTLQDFASLMQLKACRGILGPHSGPNGVAGLLAPKGKNIIIFPMEFCPSINGNYPTGMGKCLNLNGNIRHWLPINSSPDDIVAKAKAVL